MTDNTMLYSLGDSSPIYSSNLGETLVAASKAGKVIYQVQKEQLTLKEYLSQIYKDEQINILVYTNSYGFKVPSYIMKNISNINFLNKGDIPDYEKDKGNLNLSTYSFGLSTLMAERSANLVLESFSNNRVVVRKCRATGVTKTQLKVTE